MRRHHLLNAQQKGHKRNAQRQVAHHRAANDRHQRGIEAQQQHHEGRRQNARDHQHLNRRDADGAHRVNLLGQLHRPDLRREGTAGSTRDHDRGHQHAEFAQGDAADKVHRQRFRPELFELDRALLRDNNADQEAHQPDNRQSGHADQLHLVHQRLDRKAGRVADQARSAEQDLAKKADHAVDATARAIHLFAQRRRHALPRGQTGRARTPARFDPAHGGEQPLCRLARAGDVAIVFACEATHHPCADSIDLFHFGQINARERGGDAFEFGFDRADMGQHQPP